MSPSQTQTTKVTRTLVRPTANIIPAIAPDGMSRATEFAFTDRLGVALLLDGFVVSDLWLAGAELDEVGELVAPVAGLEDAPVLAAATPGEALV